MGALAEIVRKDYDPNQPRNAIGRWISRGFNALAGTHHSTTPLADPERTDPRKISEVRFRLGRGQPTTVVDPPIGLVHSATPEEVGYAGSSETWWRLHGEHGTHLAAPGSQVRIHSDPPGPRVGLGRALSPLDGLTARDLAQVGDHRTLEEMARAAERLRLRGIAERLRDAVDNLYEHRLGRAPRASETDRALDAYRRAEAAFRRLVDAPEY